MKQEIGTVKADFDQKWSDVTKRLDNMEGEWRNYKQIVENKIANLPKQQQNDDGVDKTVTLVIRNLPEEAGEDVVDKVNVLITDSVELEDIEVESAERKKSYRDNIPGVVIAICKSQEDRKQVMDKKSSLKHSDDYSNVMIFPQKSRDELRLEAIFRTILNVVGNDKLQMCGGSIVRRSEGQTGHGQTQAGRGCQGQTRGQGDGHGRGGGDHGGCGGRGGSY